MNRTQREAVMLAMQALKNWEAMEGEWSNDSRLNVGGSHQPLVGIRGCIELGGMAQDALASLLKQEKSDADISE